MAGGIYGNSLGLEKIPEIGVRGIRGSFKLWAVQYFRMGRMVIQPQQNVPGEYYV
jgi:hypothetical protein